MDAARGGDHAALARLITLVERGGDSAHEVGRLVYPLGGNAFTVGITGAPGAGKSTLTNRIIEQVRKGDEPVAVLAIDPSSPFTGGAFLGDRVRMQDHALDDGVYIRSMATRGHLGGLALAAPEAVRVLDAAGLPWVIIETVGVGQVEVEIAGEADTTIVVINPGWGDAVQANKAGLIEIADLFVINKADRPGARDTQRDLEQMLEIATPREYPPPILHTTAPDGGGVPELWDAIRAHRAWLESSGTLEARRAKRIDRELREIVVRVLERRAYDACAGAEFEQLHDRVHNRDLDPYTAAQHIIDGI